jgi:hypothetical protein
MDKHIKNCIRIAIVTAIVLLVLNYVCGGTILVAQQRSTQRIIKIHPNKITVKLCAQEADAYDRMEHYRLFIKQFCGKAYPVKEAEQLIAMQQQYARASKAWDRYILKGEDGTFIAVMADLDKLDQMAIEWAHRTRSTP